MAGKQHSCGACGMPKFRAMRQIPTQRVAHMGAADAAQSGWSNTVKLCMTRPLPITVCYLNPLGHAIVPAHAIADEGTCVFL